MADYSLHSNRESRPRYTTPSTDRGGDDAVMGMEQRMRILEMRQQRLDAERAHLEAMPPDVYGEGEVLWFVKHFNPNPDSPSYTYVAVKVSDTWFLSGPSQAGQRYRWHELMDFAEFENNDIYWASKWEQI